MFSFDIFSWASIRVRRYLTEGYSDRNVEKLNLSSLYEAITVARITFYLNEHDV